ncbi:hypothetical protein HaLaN_28749, partial [Haematococcus lacustris]
MLCEASLLRVHLIEAWKGSCGAPLVLWGSTCPLCALGVHALQRQDMTTGLAPMPLCPACRFYQLETMPGRL